MLLGAMELAFSNLTRDRVRDLSTFDPYPEVPHFAAAQLDNWLSAVEIAPVSAMEWNWPRHWIISPRVVYDSMFFWIESGSGTAWFGDPAVAIPFSAGDLLLIPQGIRHSIEATATEESHVFAVHFFATLYGGTNYLKMMGYPLRIPGRGGSPYRGISERLTREFAVKPPGWMNAMRNDIYSLLLHIVRHEADLFSDSCSRIESQLQLPRLFPVLDWIDQNLSSPDITVADLSAQVCISETHFRRLFQQVFSISPVQFIRRRRIERACTLLRTTDKPIKQVAYHCGFAEDAFFSRVFHRLVGVSPAAYRRGEYPS
jgi:AraC-like DNA-binding protein/mannose-6-phosphate isomerase-like protein (cupin superfamily)